ncbi:MAG TPA: aminoglycoside phosphotransferase family protein [Candidatus Limnocylindrales bacterium]|nr:aminoglycoside phosphotransferase family protein [Candidatus Limnocylindrales bacterium]
MDNAETVYAEPPGFDRTLLATTLKRGWGIAAGQLTYVPVGFGTHHYRAGDRWWVNVDATRRPGKLDKALRAVVALAEAGLEFVHAPRPLSNGGCVAALPGSYAVSVFEVIEGQSYEFGEFPDPELRREVLAALARLHAARPRIRPEPDSLSIPHRDTVFDALDREWAGGPFGEPARTLITQTRDHIGHLLDRYDRLVPKVVGDKAKWVVTHGEPHPGNVMRTGQGIKLIDWDTVRLAPPERDLWMIAPDGDPSAVDAAVNIEVIELYRRWWALSEICGYIAVLRAPHAEDANTRIAWRELQTYLSSSCSQY